MIAIANTPSLNALDPRGLPSPQTVLDLAHRARLLDEMGSLGTHAAGTLARSLGRTRNFS